MKFWFKVTIAIILVVAGFMFAFWQMAGRPLFRKESVVEYYIENFTENEILYAELYKDFLALDSSLRGHGSLRVVVTDRRPNISVFWCDSSTSFSDGEYYSKNDLIHKPEFHDIESKMRLLDLHSIMMVKKQMLIKPKLSKFFFSNDFLLIKGVEDLIFDESILSSMNHPDSKNWLWRINDGFYIYTKQ